MHESMRSRSMAELLDYYRDRRPGFAEAAQGASDERIEALQSAIPQSLPDDYAAFLGVAGVHNGGIFDAEGKAWSSPTEFSTHALHYDFTIDVLESRYCRPPKRKSKSRKKPRKTRQNRSGFSFVLIGTQSHSEDGGAFYLDFRQEGEPPVVNIDEYDEVTPLAPSFKDFLFENAFSGERIKGAWA